VSKHGYANLTFLEPGAEITGQYYQEVLLMQELLSVICNIAAGVLFVFQQDNAPRYWSHDMFVP